MKGRGQIPRLGDHRMQDSATRNPSNPMDSNLSMDSHPSMDSSLNTDSSPSMVDLRRNMEGPRLLTILCRPAGISNGMRTANAGTTWSKPPVERNGIRLASRLHLLRAAPPTIRLKGGMEASCYQVRPSMMSMRGNTTEILPRRSRRAGP